MSVGLLRYAVAAASLAYIGAYLVIAAARLWYPFDLEWMEGGSVDHVARVLRQEPLYLPPGIEFIPYQYPPLYYYVSAAVAKLVGIGYAPLRLVSLASSLVCFGSIYSIVRTETGRALPAILAAGLFAATFRIGGAWLDLARVDSLFLALFLLAILILRRGLSTGSSVLAGLLLSLSYLTKQTALAMALPLVLYMLYVSRRRGLWLAATLTLGAGLSTLALHVATQGWFTFYVWWFPFQHGFAAPVWTTFWTMDMFAALPIAFSCAVLLIGWQLLQRRPEEFFWPALFVGMVGGAYRSRLQTGGWDNVLLPAYAVIAIASGLAVALVVERVCRVQNTRRRFAEAAIYGTCILQLALLGYDPRAQVPRAADRAAGEHLLRVLADIPGDVLLAHHGYLPTVVGKASHAHLMSVFDILKLGDERSARLAEEFRAAIRRRDFAAIVLDATNHYFFMQDIEEAYALQSRVFSEPDVFLPVTGGVIIRPEFVYVPRPLHSATTGTPMQQRVNEAIQRSGGHERHKHRE